MQLFQLGWGERLPAYAACKEPLSVEVSSIQRANTPRGRKFYGVLGRLAANKNIAQATLFLVVIKIANLWSGCFVNNAFQLLKQVLTNKP